MSTHNIGFYEDLTKIIFKLSSIIIKYPPYSFCWMKYHICHQNLIFFNCKMAVNCIALLTSWERYGIHNTYLSSLVSCIDLSRDILSLLTMLYPNSLTVLTDLSLYLLVKSSILYGSVQRYFVTIDHVEPEFSHSPVGLILLLHGGVHRCTAFTCNHPAVKNNVTVMTQSFRTDRSGQTLCRS